MNEDINDEDRIKKNKTINEKRETLRLLIPEASWIELRGSAEK